MSYSVINGKLVRKGRSHSVIRAEAKLPADKGLKGGSCNVTACLAPGANYYNKSTQRYYCEHCAREINWVGGRAEVMALYGVPLLCELEE